MTSNTVPTDATELARTWVNAYNEQDFEQFGALYTDDVVYTIGAYRIALRGRDAFVGHIREYAGAVPDRKLTIKRVIASGDLIALETDFAGTSSGAVPALPPAGEPVTARFCTVLQLRDGKIAAQDDYVG
ncbi:nuclear transport factor 2 family protein [Streptomyces kaniharaensis]|uniref:Nuclear transport factor 2 family protein n=1 Tax=Streptomyces kaniharaensis TaxID=212423 RepID=A0A6N7L328_9ACTN|nr:nuclear transport factor 2 family protein [Streptomyces kaniharaensis]MQS16534.1 nuclear transport factor 2 family protein [Streptomyces kaniharaensis]